MTAWVISMSSFIVLFYSMKSCWTHQCCTLAGVNYLLLLSFPRQEYSVKIKIFINVLECLPKKILTHPTVIISRIATWISMVFNEFLINHLKMFCFENSYSSVQKLSSTKRMLFLYFIPSICYLFLFIQMIAITMIHSLMLRLIHLRS